jgi:WD40 repeat protein
MNQLISCCDGYVLVGLKDTAFLVNCQSNAISELKQVPQKDDSSSRPVENEDDETPVSSEKKDGDDENQKKDDNLNDIHAVALALHEKSVIYCSVARGNKSLSIYKIEIQSGLAAEIDPFMVYHTSKRISCSCFIEGGNSSASASTPSMLLAGDMAGDAYAYNLESKRQRLLLGHTASMLTGLCMSNNLLLTADRDEKIRISSFPRTFVIEGVLLGHEAYVTAVDAAAADGLVVTCGGDSTIRMWNLETQSQIFELSFQEDDELIPTDLSFNSDGSLLAVIFDQSNRLDVYRVSGSGASSERKLELVQTVSCLSQPLGVCSQGVDRFYVAKTDPNFLACYLVKDGTITEEKSEGVQALRETATNRKIVTLGGILERDQYGKIKLDKLHETRGPAAGDEPWNRSERVEIAKAANKRHKRRRTEVKRKEAKATTASPTGKTNS